MVGATSARDAGPSLESPRTRLATFGPAAMGDIELLSLVLGGSGALARAVTVHEAIGGVGGLSRAEVSEISAAGASACQAAAVAAAFELGRRAAAADLPYASSVRCPDDVARYLRAVQGDAPQETFSVLGLDARQRVRLYRVVGVGSISAVEIHPREFFRPLVRAGLHAAIACHNHPSGEPDPSENDIAITRRLAEVGRVVGIPLLDHLIVTRTRAVSLAAACVL